METKPTCRECKFRNFCKDLIFPCNECGVNFEWFEPITNKLQLEALKTEEEQTIQTFIKEIRYDIGAIKEVITLLITPETRINKKRNHTKIKELKQLRRKK